MLPFFKFDVTQNTFTKLGGYSTSSHFEERIMIYSQCDRYFGIKVRSNTIVIFENTIEEIVHCVGVAKSSLKLGEELSFFEFLLSKNEKLACCMLIESMSKVQNSIKIFKIDGVQSLQREANIVSTVMTPVSGSPVEYKITLEEDHFCASVMQNGVETKAVIPFI